MIPFLFIIRYLDDVAVHHLIDALCKLSTEAMQVAYNNKDPSLFAVAKILETGLVNLDRVEVLWKPLTAHLLDVSYIDSFCRLDRHTVAAPTTEVFESPHRY